MVTFVRTRQTAIIWTRKYFFVNLLVPSVTSNKMWLHRILLKVQLLRWTWLNMRENVISVRCISTMVRIRGYKPKILSRSLTGTSSRVLRAHTSISLVWFYWVSWAKSFFRSTHSKLISILNLMNSQLYDSHIVNAFMCISRSVVN